MKHSDGIWNNLELHRSFWHTEAFACIIVTHSETIFETAMRSNNTCFDLINPGFFENKVGKWCILSLIDTMFWPTEKMLKAEKLNGAYWPFLRPVLDYLWGGGRARCTHPPLEPLVPGQVRIPPKRNEYIFHLH